MSTQPQPEPTKSNVYALIIGINTYLAKNEFNDLSAAVSDADSVQSFLLNRLKVPSSHIINLRNTEATRAAILQAFDDLIKITAEEPNPAFIIYYAGHGARAEKPVEWESWATSGTYIELLCPCDIGVIREDGSVVEGIPDRTICAQLNKISFLRGNNITLILDCCCSAGLNRSANDAQYTPRRIENPPPISPQTDTEIITEDEETTGTRSLSTAAGFIGKYNDSHVLMAACGREQSAYEHEGKGLFTRQLLGVLQRSGSLTLTYDALLARLKMPAWQTPHFEGKNLNRLIFNVRGSRSDPFLIPVQRTKNENGTYTYTLEAGLAQGIEPNSRFDAYKENILNRGEGGRRNPVLGSLIATKVDAFTSVLEPLPEQKFPVPAEQTFFARWSDPSRQPVYIYSKDKDWINSIFPPDVAQRLGVMIADKEDQASLVLTPDPTEDVVYFDRNDTLAKPFIGSRFHHTVNKTPPEPIHEVVRAWRHFYYHLSRPSPREFPEVRMELNYLKEEEEDDELILVRTGKNLIEGEPAYVEVKTVHDTEEEEGYVGMTLFNDGDNYLYPHIFYFDPNDLTIVQWETTQHGAGAAKFKPMGVDCPLPPHSTLPLGYGTGGEPWQFEFEDGKEKDLGFFKLFITASPANFSSIRQDSPFEATRSSIVPGDPIAKEKLDPNAWGSRIFTVVQLLRTAH
ncbi:hypothetical protein CC2G_015053 [Coprinopsis cinerea AmutBmut pab1-1]|nr:hypothetical protein CC2G_015053 [Coprinopsis cinerea AmutBmut pab1-1]